MVFKSINFDEPKYGEYHQRQRSNYRGATITETTYCEGLHKFSDPVGNWKTLGTEVTLERGHSYKSTIKLPDGTEILAKKGRMGNSILDEYTKVLTRPNNTSPWSLVAYEGGNMSYTNIDFFKKLPNHVDLTSSNSPITVKWTQLEAYHNFTGIKPKMPGLTPQQTQQLKKAARMVFS